MMPGMMPGSQQGMIPNMMPGMQSNFMDMTAMFPDTSMVLNSFQNCMRTGDSALKNLSDEYKKIMEEANKKQAVQSKEALAAIDEAEAADIKKVIEATQEKVQTPVVEDGKDDGSVGFMGAMKNMGKGALKAVTGMFCDENGFSLKRTLTTAAVATAGVALCVVTGGAAAPFLVGAGVVMGGAQVVKGGLNAATAKTDAQAEQAWQEVGSGTFAVAASAIGAKGALRAANPAALAPKGNMLTSSLRAAKECTVKTSKGAYNLVRHPKTSFSELKGFYNTDLKVNVQNILGAKNAKKNATQAFENVQNKEIAKLNTQKDKLLSEIAKLEENATANATKIAEKQTVLNELNSQITQKQLSNGEVSEIITARETNNAKIKSQTEEIKNLMAERNKIDPVDNLAEWTKAQAKLEAKINARAAEVTNPSTAGARSNQVSNYKANIERINLEIKNAKANGLTKEQVNALKSELKISEQQMKKAETYQAIEAKEQQIATAKNRIQKANDKVVKPYEEKIKLLNEQNEVLAKTPSTANDATRLANQKQINEYQNIIDKANKFITKQNVAVKTAEASLSLKNFKFAKAEAQKNIRHTIPAVLLVNGLAVDAPQMQETLVKGEKQDELLAEVKKYYDGQRAQLEASLKENSQEQIYNPFAMNPAMGMGAMGGFGGAGQDSLSFYQSPFPPMI